MNRNLPTRRMREHPDLQQLKRQAKELLHGFATAQPAAVAEVRAHYRGAEASTFALHDAQLVLARSYGFDSWPKLKAYVDGVTVRRLAEAIRANDLERVNAMLRARPEIADMTMSYGDEHRPIHFAVMQRSPEIVRLLMQHGADARQGIHPHRDATSAWTLASERGYDEIVAMIEEEEGRREAAEQASAEEEASEELTGDEAARSAVAAGDMEWTTKRLAEGKLVNPIRWDGGGLLTVAVEHNRLEMLRCLLDAGFDPDERVSMGEGDSLAYSQGYPLWHAAALGRRDMAELLLERGANPNVHVDSSGSAVYSAYSHKQWETVDLLRKHGGVVTADIAGLYRQTDLARQMLAGNDGGALAAALVPPEKPVAEELLLFGASGGDPEIVEMALGKIDWPRDDPRWFRCATKPLGYWHHIPWLYAGNREFDRRTYLACFRLILHRCDPNVTGGFGRTILHEIAAMDTHVTEEEVAEFGMAALDAGAVVKVRDEILKSTSLGWACRWGRPQLAGVLLERGADPVEAGAEPWATPRAWAAKMGHSDVLSVLAQYGG